MLPPSYALVLFDVDGCTAIIQTKRIKSTSVTKTLKSEIVWGNRRHAIEVLEIADSTEELDAYELEWCRSHRALAVDKRKEQSQAGGYLECWPDDVDDESKTGDSSNEMARKDQQPRTTKAQTTSKAGTSRQWPRFNTASKNDNTSTAAARKLPSTKSQTASIARAKNDNSTAAARKLPSSKSQTASIARAKNDTSTAAARKLPSSQSQTASIAGAENDDTSTAAARKLPSSKSQTASIAGANRLKKVTSTLRRVLRKATAGKKEVKELDRQVREQRAQKHKLRESGSTEENRGEKRKRIENKTGTKPNVEERDDGAESDVQKNPGIKEGTNGRKITVFHEGSGDSTTDIITPAREPFYVKDLTQDQIDIIEIRVGNFDQGKKTISTQTDPVLIFSDEVDMMEQFDPKERRIGDLFTLLENQQREIEEIRRTLASRSPPKPAEDELVWAIDLGNTTEDRDDLMIEEPDNSQPTTDDATENLPTNTSTGEATIPGTGSDNVDHHPSIDSPDNFTTDTSTEVATVPGTDSGVVTVPGTGSGVVTVPGTASGVVTVPGTASGVVTVPGTGSGVVTVSGTGSGVVTVPGTDSGVVAVPGTGSGVVTVHGTGSGVVTVHGTGSGVVTVPGTISGVVTVPGTGSGVVTVPGTGSGVVTVPATGSGVVTVPATGSGVVTVPATGSGVVTVPATGSGVVTVPATGSGVATVPWTSSLVATEPGTSFMTPIVGSGSFMTPTVGSGSFMTPTVGSGSFMTQTLGTGSFMTQTLGTGSDSTTNAGVKYVSIDELIASPEQLDHFEKENTYTAIPILPALTMNNNDLRPLIEISSPIDMINASSNADVRVAPDLQTSLRATSNTVGHFGWKVARSLFSNDELRSRNYYGRGQGKQALSPRRRFAIEKCVRNTMGPNPDYIKEAVEAINTGIRNTFKDQRKKPRTPFSNVTSV